MGKLIEMIDIKEKRGERGKSTKRAAKKKKAISQKIRESKGKEKNLGGAPRKGEKRKVRRK